MDISWVSNAGWFLQRVPLFGLLCYVAFQWRRIIGTLSVIAFAYSFIKNILAIIMDSHKLPKTALPLLFFYDILIGIINLTNLIYLDISYVRAFLNVFPKLSGIKACPSTSVSVEKVTEDADVYVYKPGKISNKGCVIYIHGGGWSFLSARCYSTGMSWMSHYLEMVVVSVEYRLAPEHPFPAGLTDCYNAVQWVHDNSESLDVDVSKVFVAGDSAGGNLSAALCLLYRDRQGAPLESDGLVRPSLAGQILLYPVVQCYTNSVGSMETNAAYFPPPDSLPSTVSMYAVGSKRLAHHFGRPDKFNKVPKFWTTLIDKTADSADCKSQLKEVKSLSELGAEATLEDVMINSYILPLHAEDLSNLPPAYVQVATADTLRDEGEWYAKYLEHFQVRVVFSEVKHCHGFMMDYKNSGTARDELMKIKEFIESEIKS